VDVTGLTRSEGGASPASATSRAARAHSRGASLAGDLLPSAAPLLATASATVSGDMREVAAGGAAGAALPGAAAAAAVAAAAAAAGPGRGAAGLTPRETGESLEDDFYASSMSVLCPLDDDSLPMDASNLKSKQVGPAALRSPAGGASATGRSLWVVWGAAAAAGRRQALAAASLARQAAGLAALGPRPLAASAAAARSKWPWPS
jgi:hypothetical protein